MQDGCMAQAHQNNQNRTPTELLHDPTRVCVSVSEAAQILGVAKSTAHSAYASTGCLIDGVPVMRVGKRLMVSLYALRAALAIDEPSVNDDDNV